MGEDMRNRILITGGAGFIGERLARALASDSASIVIFDNLHRQVHGDNPRPPQLPANTSFFFGDVCDASALSEAVRFADADVIYHLAAETGTGQSYDEPARYCDVNILGTAHLIESVRAAARVRVPRIVLAGSRAVYGEGAYRRRDGTLIAGATRTVAALKAGRFDPVDSDGLQSAPAATPETLPPSPASVYASTKLMQEELLSHCAEGGQYDVVLLRFQNVYGPGQSLKNPYTGVLSIFATQILQGRRLNIFEDGQIVRDFVFVDDVVDALVRAGRIVPAPKGPVNIGSGERATILECARILLEHLGADTANYEVTGEFRAGDIRHALADIAKAEAVLGWRPKTSLTNGLSALAAWVRAERQAADSPLQ